MLGQFAIGGQLAAEDGQQRRLTVLIVNCLLYTSSFFSEEMNEFVDLLPAQQRVHGENWYRGTADAVAQNLDIITTYSAL